MVKMQQRLIIAECFVIAQLMCFCQPTICFQTNYPPKLNSILYLLVQKRIRKNSCATDVSPNHNRLVPTSSRNHFLYGHLFNDESSIESSQNESHKSIMVSTNETNKNTIRTDDESLSILTSCPYSMTFPRYRIDLTSSPTRKKNNQKQSLVQNNNYNNYNNTNKNNKIGFFSMVSDWTSSLKEREIREEISRRIRKDSISMEWYPNIDTLEAYSALWNLLATCFRKLVCKHKESTTSLTLPSSSVIIVACFPNANPIVIQNWYEIFTWIQEQDFVLQGNNPQIKVKADYNYVKDVPTIQFEIEVLSFSNNTFDRSADMVNPNHSYNHDIITKRTQAWVKRILVDQGICPFTKSEKRSGQGLADVNVPVGKIAYHSSLTPESSNQLMTFVQLQADTWNSIVDMIVVKGPSGPDGVSSILLAAPDFDDDFPLWAGPVFASLEAGVVAAQCTDRVGVVCFHPLYSTPDGTTWPGFGHMHSVPRLNNWYKQETPNPSLSSLDLIAAGGAWQRRTPHATINVLRADQLAAAEKKRNTPALYSTNINKLVVNIGCDQLAMDLHRERTLL